MPAVGRWGVGPRRRSEVRDTEEDFAITGKTDSIDHTYFEIGSS